jgi:hypothetical protein
MPRRGTQIPRRLDTERRGGAILMGQRRSEFGGKDTPSRLGVNPMKGQMVGKELTEDDRLGLVYRTGHEDTSRPEKRNAWLGWEDVPIPPPRSKIPPE